MSVFKVGDKIRAKKTANANYSITNAKNRWEGIVVEVRGDKVVAKTTKINDALVKCLYAYHESTEYTVDPQYFEKISSHTPVTVLITYDSDKTVAAMLKVDRVTKKAEAKCSPEDEFDLYTGADLALKRLFGKDTPKENKDDDKPFDGLALCVGSSYVGFTKNHIYQFKNGHCIDDNGDRRPDATVPFYSKECLKLLGFQPFSERPALLEHNNKQIYITYDGNKTVTAVLKENGAIKKAEAKCSPEDEFDLYTGADLALKRLFGKDIPKENTDDDKPFKGLAICTIGCTAGFTKNCVYQFKNGHCIDDDGDRRPFDDSPFVNKKALAIYGLGPYKSKELK